MSAPPSTTALAKRSASTALMPPPPPPKKIKRPTQALEEDEYEDAISHIIKRDFFPGLAESESQKEYLAALETDDPDWIAEAGQRLQAVSTPGPAGRQARGEHANAGRLTPMAGLRATVADTPRGWVGDTPMSERDPGSSEDKEEKKGANTELGLGEFQARYTSEDNESFYKLVDKSNKKRGEKYSWLWADNKIPTARQLEWQARDHKKLADRVAETTLNDGKELVTMDYTDKRKAAPEAWKAKPKNSFMFAPDLVEDSVETIQQRAEASSLMGPKEIVYENTRMPPPPKPKSGNVPPSPSLSAVRDAIAGHPRLSGSEIGTSDAGGGGETPRVNGYAFVDSEEPEPEPDTESGSSWSARVNLGPGDSTPNPFEIRKAGNREALHYRMVDKLNSKKQDERQDAFRASGHGGLTPAGQRLLGRVGGLTPKTNDSLGDGWGRTPRSKPALAGVTPVRKR